MAFEDSRDIPGYENKYRVDSYGNIYSIGNRTTKKIWNTIKINTCKNNRSYVGLYKNGKGKFWLVHRLVYTVFVRPLLLHEEIDHINRVSTDNRLCNLRVATSAQNKYNSTKRILSKYKGVEFIEATGKYRVRVAKKHIGCFDTEIRAAVIYDLKAIEKFGIFANPNFLFIADNLKAEEALSH